MMLSGHLIKAREIPDFVVLGVPGLVVWYGLVCHFSAPWRGLQSASRYCKRGALMPRTTTFLSRECFAVVSRNKDQVLFTVGSRSAVFSLSQASYALGKELMSDSP